MPLGFALSGGNRPTFESTRLLPWGLHNLLVSAVVLLLIIWVLKVGYQLAIVSSLHQRLRLHRALQLEHMSIYVKDFHQIIRQHFNQILRMRRTVPPRDVPRYTLLVHLCPTSVRVVENSGLMAISFKADSTAGYSARFFWGVPVEACDTLLQRFCSDDASGNRGNAQSGMMPWVLNSRAMFGGRGDHRPVHPLLRQVATVDQEMQTISSSSEPSGVELFVPSQFVASSRSAPMPAGLEQLCEPTPDSFIDRSRLGFNNMLWPREGGPVDRDALVPLVVVLCSTTGRKSGETVLEATFINFRQAEPDDGNTTGLDLRAEVLHQVVLNDTSAHHIQGIYGFEEGDNETECMICYDQPRSVLFLPCRHFCVCSSCFRLLRDERCPLCRSVFSAHILLPLKTEQGDLMT